MQTSTCVVKFRESFLGEEFFQLTWDIFFLGGGFVMEFFDTKSFPLIPGGMTLLLELGSLVLGQESI